MARGFNYAPGASPEVLEAQQPGLHRTHIMALGASRNVLVRTNVAARADCPLGLMVTLAHDYHADVRSAVARNPTAQRTVMAYLAADRTPSVVLALLENPSLPADILEELAFHKKAAVRAAAAHRLDAGLAPVVEAEDAHTPELAEHVRPMSAGGEPAPEAGTQPAPGPETGIEPEAAAAPQPTNVVDLVTGEPITAPGPTSTVPPLGSVAPTQFAPVPSEGASAASGASVYPEPFPAHSAALAWSAPVAFAPSVPSTDHPVYYGGATGSPAPRSEAPAPAPVTATVPGPAGPGPAPASPVATTPTDQAAAADAGSEGYVPQIFSPHSTPEAPAPTRTAPVRGFKVKD